MRSFRIQFLLAAVGGLIIASCGQKKKPLEAAADSTMAGLPELRYVDEGEERVALLPVVMDSLVGLVDTNGRQVVPCRYGYIQPTTIDLLICKSKDNLLAQYALESSTQPIGISSYELEKLYPQKVEGTIPTIEELEHRLLGVDEASNPQ